ncbi:hypothetical protein ACHAQH_005259 [Verticillium albo-atrum]
MGFESQKAVNDEEENDKGGSTLDNPGPQSTSSKADLITESFTLSTSAIRPSISRELALSYCTVTWFLPPSAWVMAYEYSRPSTLPSPSVFNSFVRGLQAWLVRYLREGHSPLIHRHLYTESHMPQDMQDAIATMALSQTSTPDNEHLINTISSAYLSSLLARHADDLNLIVPDLSTRDHLARTQALLIHLLLALFSPSITRRAEAERHLSNLLLWARQLWDSANLDAATSSLVPFTPDADTVTGLYRAFVLTESVRRTFLIANIATGVYLALRSGGDPPDHVCTGDVCFTLHAGLWDAAGASRREARAMGVCPLFLHSTKGQTLFDLGVPAREVDEFARHVFTLTLGVEKVENWAVRTGDEVTVGF